MDRLLKRENSESKQLKLLNSCKDRAEVIWSDSVLMVQSRAGSGSVPTPEGSNHPLQELDSSLGLGPELGAGSPHIGPSVKQIKCGEKVLVHEEWKWSWESEVKANRKMKEASSFIHELKNTEWAKLWLGPLKKTFQSSDLPVRDLHN